MAYHLGTMTKRILREYDAATPHDIIDGSHWYDNASTLAESMAETYGQPLHVCAAVIAALSPRQTWSVNVRFADAMIAAFSNGALEAPNCGLGNSGKRAQSFTTRQYETIAQAYRNAAKLRDITPRDMQAITWVHVRGKAQ